MSRFQAPVALLASWRIVPLLVLAIGLLAWQGERGTLAYYTSSKSNAGNQFTAGKLDISASGITSGTSSTLTFSTTGSTGSGASCDVSGTTGGPFNPGQPMVPAVFCTGKLTVSNGASTNLDFYLRIRLVRTAGSNAAGADLTMNNMLKLYMNEVTAGDACNKTTFTPTLLTLGTPVNLAAGTPVNGKVVGAGGLGITATAASLTEAGMTTGTYANLVGNDAMSGDLAPGATSATVPTGTSRYFCVAIWFPSDTAANSLAQSNTGGDNAAQQGANTYAIQMVAAQKPNR